jgi:aspartyl-tRNA synthetase
LNEVEIQDIVEGLIAKVLKDTKGIELPLPFPRMAYEHAMNFYGSDKPDTRFEMLLQDLTATVKKLTSRSSQKRLLLRPLWSRVHG